jgi:hypothetical protein
MNATIRSYIKYRVRWCLAVGIGGWVIIASAIGSRADNPLINILGFLIFGGAMLALQWIKCPRCSARLGQIGMALAAPVFRPQPNFCPYCGVNFDEPRTREPAAGQPAPFNPIR